MTSRRTRLVHAEPATVWEILADGWLYPAWVVGASRMREVDRTWPEAGSRIHHSVGVWPLLVDDDTEVVESHAPSLLELRARLRPWGEAVVRLTLEATGGETLVVMEEDVKSGPGRLVPMPLRVPALDWRNSETLRRLAYLAERRPSHVGAG